MKAAHETLLEDRLNWLERHLTKSVNSFAPWELLSFLSDLGELDDNARERILQLARVTYDYVIEQQEGKGAWDHGCYRD